MDQYRYKYRIVANKDKTKFKAQAREKFFLFIDEMYLDEDAPSGFLLLSSIPVLGMLVCLLIPIIVFLIDGTVRYTDIDNANDPLKLEVSINKHKEKHKIEYEEKYTVYLKV